MECCGSTDTYMHPGAAVRELAMLGGSCEYCTVYTLKLLSEVLDTPLICCDRVVDPP
jgi:hypothetical protein